MAKKSLESNAASVSSQEAVAQLAHEIWEREGRPEGRALEHWYRAVSELKAQSNGENRLNELNTAVEQTTTTPKRQKSRAASEKQFQAARQ